MKFLDNLTEALRSIPQDLPGEDKWGQKVSYYEILDHVHSRLNIAEYIIDNPQSPNPHGPPENILARMHNILGSYPDLEAIAISLFDSVLDRYGEPVTEEWLNQLKDRLNELIEKLNNSRGLNYRKLNEAMRRNIPQGLPGEDEWGAPGNLWIDVAYRGDQNIERKLTDFITKNFGPVAGAEETGPIVFYGEKQDIDGFEPVESTEWYDRWHNWIDMNHELGKNVVRYTMRLPMTTLTATKMGPGWNRKWGDLDVFSV